MHIETITPISNSGAPKKNGCGNSKIAPRPTSPQFTRPMTVAMMVPIDQAEQHRHPRPEAGREPGDGQRDDQREERRAAGWSPTPKFGFSTVCRTPLTVVVIVGLPRIQRSATGNSERPMIVMMQPVTTGGKNRTTLAKIGAMRKPNSPATITAPKMVARRALESPMRRVGGHRRHRAHGGERHALHQRQLRPDVGHAERLQQGAEAGDEQRRGDQQRRRGGVSPAALAMMIGGETTPAYIARMCCRP